MKKKFLLIFLLIFLTGCDATYNINIDDKINEITNFKFEQSDYNYEGYNYASEYYESTNVSSFSSMDEFVSDTINNDYLAFTNINDKFYKKSKIDDNGMSLSYKYNYNNFSKSYIANYCGNINRFYDTDKTIIITAEDFTNCFLPDYGPYLNNLTINIKTDLKVIDNNADSINGKIYTWKINSDNASDKKIKIEIIKASNYKRVIKYVITFIIIIIVLSFIIFYFIRKSKKNNEI